MRTAGFLVVADHLQRRLAAPLRYDRRFDAAGHTAFDVTLTAGGERAGRAHAIGIIVVDDAFLGAR